MVKPKPMGLPRDSLERRRGGRGGPAPRRDRLDSGAKVAKRMNNDYNSQYKRDATAAGAIPQRKKGGFNPMAKAHMGSEAYKGHAKKLKAELIHKAKVKKEFAKVLKKEEDNTPEFYKKIFGERTIDDNGNIVEYKTDDGQQEQDDDQKEDEDDEMSGSDEDAEMQESGSGSEEVEQDDSEEEEEKPASKKSKGKKGDVSAAATKPGKQEDGTFKRAQKPNPFKAAIEKREAEKKAIQEARERAQRERALAKKGRDAYYANRQKTTKKMREKTPRGQPVLANQIKMMLGKIKEDVKGNTSRAPIQKKGGHGGRQSPGSGRVSKKGSA
ncbi:hypothetical protein BGZ50_002864 [Haplosporangium sp. Z 11]|nr:hypothetical protein BGZ50_002864 [Haplosporangium sp. Z 11]